MPQVHNVIHQPNAKFALLLMVILAPRLRMLEGFAGPPSERAGFNLCFVDSYLLLCLSPKLCIGSSDDQIDGKE